MLSDFTAVVQPDTPDAALLARIDWTRLPRHIAIIMDGNGRWANQRGQQRISGHRAGVESVRAAVDTGARLGLGALTLYAFSTENWKRPRPEVSALMRMLRWYIKQELAEIHRQNIRFQALGRIAGLTAAVQRELARATEHTRHNTGMVLSIALNYGGRSELVDAARAVLHRFARENRAPESLEESDLERELYTQGLPELDLLVRTSGEMRISNFLLWQVAYSEIHVTPTLWPDFRRQHLLAAILDYQNRDRRYGGVNMPPDK